PHDFCPRKLTSANLKTTAAFTRLLAQPVLNPVKYGLGGLTRGFGSVNILDRNPTAWSRGSMGRSTSVTVFESCILLGRAVMAFSPVLIITSHPYQPREVRNSDSCR